MAHRRHDLWLLIRLAAQNVGRRRLRAIFLSAAVMLGVGIAFAELRRGLGIARWHDDQLFPHGRLIRGRSTRDAREYHVEPFDCPTHRRDPPRRLGSADRSDPRRRGSGAAAHRPRAGRGKRREPDVHPAHDLSVLTWLAQRQSGPVEGLIAGGGLAARLGELVSVCGMPMRIYGRLGKTGVGPFDDSYFLELRRTRRHGFVLPHGRRAGCSQANVVKPQDKPQDEPPVPGMSHAGDVCSPDLALDRVSAFRVNNSRPAQEWTKSSSRSRGFPTSRSSKATP